MSWCFSGMGGVPVMLRRKHLSQFLQWMPVNEVLEWKLKPGRWALLRKKAGSRWVWFVWLGCCRWLCANCQQILDLLKNVHLFCALNRLSWLGWGGGMVPRKSPRNWTWTEARVQQISAPFCQFPCQGCSCKSSEVSCGSQPVWGARVPAPHRAVRLWGTSGDGHSGPNVCSSLHPWTANAGIPTRGWGLCFQHDLWEHTVHTTISSSFGGWWLCTVVRTPKDQHKSEWFGGLGKHFPSTVAILLPAPWNCEFNSWESTTLLVVGRGMT